MSVATDYYALLGVEPSATEEEMKRAYRRLARELHPDANGGDAEAEERFKEVTVAYEVLRDPERRRRYDMFGPEAVRGAGSPGASGGFGFGNAESVFGAGLGDLFDTFFGGSPFGSGTGGGRGRGGRAGPPRGQDMEAVIELDFADAVFGTSHELTLRAPVPCEACGASGARAGTTPTTCSSCSGAGEIRRVRQSILGQMVTASVCPRCGGTGEEVASPCPECRGEGRRTAERAYTVEVPAGIDDGQTLRLSGRGAAGARGGAAGDLYVHVRVRPHERFRRQGFDLVHELHISMTQAALGVHLSYPTLDGVEDLVIAAGTQNGRVYRLRGRGVPHVEGRGRGDLLVAVVVNTPTQLTREQEELVRRLAVARGEEVAPAESGFFSKVRSAFK
ncbi:MAG: molecular chaperone DnaJ [Acidimicrobiales bacterium]